MSVGGEDRSRQRVLLLASTSAPKRLELAEMLAAAQGLEAIGGSPRVIGLDEWAAMGHPAPDVEENAPDFLGNAALKARAFVDVARQVGAKVDLVLADDSGLCVDALDGAPGVHSARWGGEPRTDERNNAALVAALTQRGLERSAAQYRCALVLGRTDDGVWPSAAGATAVARDLVGFAGVCEGVAAVDARGDGGFGYDPHMWIVGEARTFAELSRAEKAARSHRGAALRALVQALPALLVTGA